MFIKKFFNDDAEGVTGVATEAAPISIAALMATQGKTNMTGEIPEIYTEPAGQTPVEHSEESAVAASESQEAPVELAQANEVETQTQAPTQEAAPPNTPAEVPLSQVLSKHQPQAVLKELGFDEKMVSFLNYWKDKGDVTAYLKEMTTDYSKMPAEEVMKHQLRQEYPKASEAQLEVLFQEEVLDRYRLTDDYSEEQQERGKLLLDAKAEQYRDKLIEKQKDFILPTPPEAPVDDSAEKTQKMLDSNKRSVMDSQYFRQVISNNKLTIGEGDESFSFQVNGNDLIDTIYDPVKFLETMFEVNEKDGEVQLVADPKHQLLVAAIAKHGEAFLKEYAKHYKAVGSKKAIDPIENPSGPRPATANHNEAPPKTIAEAMARQGRLVG